MPLIVADAITVLLEGTDNRRRQKAWRAFQGADNRVVILGGVNPAIGTHGSTIAKRFLVVRAQGVSGGKRQADAEPVR